MIAQRLQTLRLRRIRQGLIDLQLLHDREAQAVDKAVRLVLVPLEVGEGGSLFLWARPMNARI